MNSSVAPPTQVSSRSAVEQYFLSGWLFLVPYLYAYLLYGRMGWPVNAVVTEFHPTFPPPLIHVYWALHGVNLICASAAICAYWRRNIAIGGASTPSAQLMDRLASGLPWILLGLLFFIPGTYLEFPADTWAHYARIYEWSKLTGVAGHSAGDKASYFIPYSLIGGISIGRQRIWLDVYHTAISLLLCWQYFRLAMAVGVGRSSAIIFVILQAVLLGNNIFSFYRYYGIASTIYSQIGAVALVRVWAEAAGGSSVVGSARFPNGKQNPWLKCFSLLASSFLLWTLIVHNHVQGLGIAGLGLAAVGVWRLLKWKFWVWAPLVVIAIVLSLIVVYVRPHHPAIDQFYRPTGWLNIWYGFNLLSPFSPAGDRMMQILGIVGVANLGAGVLLLRSNHIVGWITIMPVLALCFPFIAVPFSIALASGGDWGNIIVYHRMFFAIPPGLAVVCLGHSWSLKPPPWTGMIPDYCRKTSAPLALSLFALATVPLGAPFYNRFWHALALVPDDLTMQREQTGFHRYVQSGNYRRNSIFAATSGLGFIMTAAKPLRLVCNGRTYYNDAAVPSANLEQIRNILSRPSSAYYITVTIPDITQLYTPYSTAAICSQHWLPQETSLAFSGANELRDFSFSRGLRSIDFTGPIAFFQWDNPDVPLQRLLGSPISSGHFSCRVHFAAGPNPWSTLLAVDSQYRERTIYITAFTDSGALYYNFDGHQVGPADIRMTQNPDRQIDFSWSGGHQELRVDGEIALESAFPAPAGSARQISVGWHGSDASEAWYGNLDSARLSFGSPP